MCGFSTLKNVKLKNQIIFNVGPATGLFFMYWLKHKRFSMIQWNKQIIYYYIYAIVPYNIKTICACIALSTLLPSYHHYKHTLQMLNSSVMLIHAQVSCNTVCSDMIQIADLLAQISSRFINLTTGLPRPR